MGNLWLTNSSKKFQCYLILCVLLYVVNGQVFAERKTFTFSADYTEASLAKGKEYTTLRGNATVVADDVQIEAEEVKLYGDDFQFAEVLGKFSAIDLKNDFSLSGDSLFYDRTEKLLRAEGNILMKDAKNDVTIRAHFLESKNDGDFMIVQLGVRITKKKELSARTEFLTYYRETEILEMTGFPYALWKDDEYRADRVSINLDNDEVVLEGKVQGFISTLQEDENGGGEDPKTGETSGETSSETESEGTNTGEQEPNSEETESGAANGEPSSEVESEGTSTGEQALNSEEAESGAADEEASSEVESEGANTGEQELDSGGSNSGEQELENGENNGETSGPANGNGSRESIQETP